MVDGIEPKIAININQIPNFQDENSVFFEPVRDTSYNILQLINMSTSIMGCNQGRGTIFLLKFPCQRIREEITHRFYPGLGSSLSNRYSRINSNHIHPMLLKEPKTRPIICP